MMQVSVSLPWCTTTYNTTLGDMVAEYARTTLENIYVEVSDGCRSKDDVPSQEEFCEALYNDIVNGSKCEVNLDGTCIEYVFPDAVRFFGKSVITEIISDCYTEVR